MRACEHRGPLWEGRRAVCDLPHGHDDIHADGEFQIGWRTEDSDTPRFLGLKPQYAALLPMWRKAEDTMTDAELAAIEARARGATEGPWEAGDVMVVANLPGIEFTVCGTDLRADAAFIAAARTDVPALVEEVRRLRAVLRGVEWQGVHNVLSGDDWAPGCPVCSRVEPGMARDYSLADPDSEGHSADCALKAALGE